MFCDGRGFAKWDTGFSQRSEIQRGTRRRRESIQVGVSGMADLSTPSEAAGNDCQFILFIQKRNKRSTTRFPDCVRQAPAYEETYPTQPISKTIPRGVPLARAPLLQDACAVREQVHLIVTFILLRTGRQCSMLLYSGSRHVATLSATLSGFLQGKS